MFYFFDNLSNFFFSEMMRRIRVMPEMFRMFVFFFFYVKCFIAAFAFDLIFVNFHFLLPVAMRAQNQS